MKQALRGKTQVNYARLMIVFSALALTLIIQVGQMKLSKFQSISYALVNNCTVLVPNAPLTSKGLMTPWEMLPPCSESNPNQQIFLQAVIFNPENTQLTVYNPLVIDQGTTPAIAPVTLTLPTGAVVGLFGGANDDQTFLANNTSCDTTTGQVFYCNTNTLFNAVNAAHISIPPLGYDRAGHRCPSVRSFKIVDQDQSDNVQTSYLLTPTGELAQDTTANRGALPAASVVVNPSDNRVLSIAVDGALGCVPWKIPDVTDGGKLVPTQATDELQAAAYQRHPVALIPAGDPMVGPNNLEILNTYRRDVDQPMVDSLGAANTQSYCRHLIKIGGTFIANHMVLFSGFPSPVAGFANLYDFLHQRWIASQQILGCHQIK